MNLTYLWPTLAILTVVTIWLTVYNLRRFDTEGKREPRKPLFQLAFGCVGQWVVIAGTIALGYMTAGILGAVAVIVSLVVLPVVTTIIVAAALGRIRRV